MPPFRHALLAVLLPLALATPLACGSSSQPEQEAAAGPRTGDRALAAAILAGERRPSEAPDAELQAVRRTIEPLYADMNAALAARDTDRALSHFAPDYSWLDETATRSGLAELRAELEGFFAEEPEARWELDTRVTGIARLPGDRVQVTTSEDNVVHFPDGQGVLRRATNHDVWIQEEGAWRLLETITTDAMERPLPAGTARTDV